MNRAIVAIVGALAVAGGVAAAVGSGDTVRDRRIATEAAMLTGGDARRAPLLIQRYGCGSCHVVPGVPGARGARVGPALDDVATRVYIAGVLTNTADHLVRWIQDPKAIDPLTAMPDLGVSEQDARDIAAYLYGLR